MKNLTRRQALKNAAAGASALSLPSAGISQENLIEVAGHPVEVLLTTVSPETVRVTVQPIENGQAVPIPSDGALVKEDWGKSAARLRSLSGARKVKCGRLNVTLSNSPLTIRVEAEGGRLVQELKCDPAGPDISFPIGDGPLLGLGQGGPQFDRRGNVDRMRSGQGGYQLHTNGAKVPIQLAIGTSGWAMFVHSPLGAFDLTGKDGHIQPADSAAALPIDIFVIGAKNPETVMGAYAEITGHPEMPPLWIVRLSAVASYAGHARRDYGGSKNVP